MISRKKSINPSKLIILIIIIGCMIAVVVATICSFIFTPENKVKSIISDLASDYYENHLYASFDFDNADQETKNQFMKKYENRGLTATTLRQLLLYDHKKNADVAPLLKKYCDENSTYIKIFPEYPFSKTSYRIEYIYSCEF